MDLKRRLNLIIRLISIINLLALLMIWRSNYCTSVFVSAYSSGLFMLTFIVWFFMASRVDKFFLSDLLKQSSTLLVFIMINIILNLIFLGTVDQETINYIIVFIFCSILIFYDHFQEILLKKIVILIILIDTAIKAIVTIGALEVNPGIVKQMSVAGASDMENYRVLIADYSTVYVCVLITVFLVSILGITKKRVYQLIDIVFLVIFGFFLFKCSFFFALLLLVYGIVGAVFIKENRMFVLLPIIGILVVLVFRGLISDFCYYMAQQPYWSEIIQGKWNDMALLLGQGAEAAYMSDMRLELMYQSWETFLARPFFGIYSLNINTLSIGKHSAWLDGLGNYGIFRFPLFIVFLVKIFKRLADKLYDPKAVYISISIFCLLSIVNPHVFPQMWVFFMVIIPFVTDIVQEANQKWEKNTSKSVL